MPFEYVLSTEELCMARKSLSQSALARRFEPISSHSVSIVRPASDDFHRTPQQIKDVLARIEIDKNRFPSNRDSQLTMKVG